MSVYRPQERRLVLRLLAYWDDLRGAREYPRVDEIDPVVLGDDWPYCHIVALATPLEGSSFRHVGACLADGLAELDRLTLADTPDTALLHHATHYLDKLLDKRVPVSIGGEARLARDSVLYRSILLPLSNDGVGIDHVLGAANSRRVEEAAA